MTIAADIMPIGEAADVLGVPQAQLRRWALQGVGPHFEGHPLLPERIQYRYAELLDWQDRVRQDIYEVTGIAELGRTL